MLRVAHADGADEIDKLAEPLLVEGGAVVLLGRTPLSDGLSRSIATIASSISLPMVGCLALARRWDHRASFGTQKTFSARYSSGSSGSAPWTCWANKAACFSSKASEMYLRKSRPSTTCLYSAASMLLRSLSAACQSVCSKPSVAPLLPFTFAFDARAILKAILRVRCLPPSLFGALTHRCP